MKGTLRHLNAAARRLARREDGTQLVELAIVLPVMLVMFGAVAEFGRFFYTYQTLAKATRAGARYLTTEPADGSSDAKAENLVVYGNTTGTGDPVVSGLSAGNVSVERSGGPSSMPERVTVKIVGYTYSPLFDLGKLVGVSGLSLNVDVSPATTMRTLGSTAS
ncbi:MAG TPA: TadE/TadG family type IV pilus assembly protein [Pyrinomonadaceae bacterium]|nr:TadE/TadG family type IV pilus assembly protein [Pyrinomonadaceae bacterium]